MSIETDDAHAEHPTGPYWTGLWLRVRDWLAQWVAVFPPDEIIRDGLTRRLALRCCNWLWQLEAAVRRMIVAAALAVDPAMLGHASPGRQPRDSSGPSSRPSPRTMRTRSFRILAFRGAGSQQTTASAVMAASTERHLPFPGDPLLRLGSPRTGRNPSPAVRRLHPLQRHGRIRPSDPDYIPESEADYANTSPLLFGSPEAREPSLRREPGTRSGFRYRVTTESGESEWRRIDREWARVLPAPGIAARIRALAGALNAPEPLIQRLARRLAAQPHLAALLRDAPPPILRKPKYDRFGPQVDEDLVMLAYTATQAPDTS